ncbi:hypothetical protein HQ531_03510 [bacterium]|nr:hypothetical protein [bacterium]
MNHRLQEIAQKFFIRGSSVAQIAVLMKGLVNERTLYRLRKSYDWNRDRELTRERLKALKANYNSATYLVARLRKDGSASELIDAKDEVSRIGRELKDLENSLASADQELKSYRFELMTPDEKEEYLEKVQLERAIQSGTGAVVNSYVNLRKSKRDILKETILVSDDLFEYLAEHDPEFLKKFMKYHWRPFVMYIVDKYRKAGVDISAERFGILTKGLSG